MDGLKEIKAKDLGSVYISHEDIEIVKYLAKGLKFKYTMFTIFLLYAVLVTALISIPDIITLNLSIPICMFFLVSIFLFYQLVTVVNAKKSFKTLTPKKAQYGILKEKYIVTEQTDNGSHKTYYMNVEFPMNSTIIQGAKSALSIYNGTKLGDKVLVVSFDNKEAYAMKSNSN